MRYRILFLISVLTLPFVLSCGTGKSETTNGSSSTPAPTITLSVDPTQIGAGSSATLKWVTTNTTTVVIDGVGTFGPNNQTTVAPQSTTTYKATATGDGGSASSTAVLTVTTTSPPPPVKPTVTLSVSPSSIAPGGTATLAWSSTNATAVTIDNGIGLVAPSDTKDVYPTATTTYTATATGDGGASLPASTLLTVTAANQPPLSTSGDISVVDHIVLAVQENRSFDHYFGRLAEYQRQKGMTPDVEEIPLGVALTDKSGHLIHPFHQATVCHEGITPAWGASHVDYNDGKMNNFLHTVNNSSIDVDGTRAIGYYDWRDLPYYYELATQFAISDRFFSSLLARTPPNRMYLVGASSYGNVDSGSIPASAPTIFDRLSDAGISWKYYYQEGVQVRLNGWNTAKKHPENIVPMSQYFTDLSNGTFPHVAFLERGVGLDEHPTNNIQKGAADLKTAIDALMQSYAWPSSALFLTYDEGGGLYDHVPPFTVPAPDNVAPKLKPGDKPGDFTLSGFRIPFIVVSPWARPNFVSHVNRETTSMLKFIETRYNLPPLTKRDAWADDLTELFDFKTPHLLTVPALPEQPVNGVCNYQKEISPEHPK